ncbi:unnamed protein product [Ranitomeya imitator]|uniref:Uncharacterized protein n=1 Tax=Ranitomeya imitator TaxID=111125 RepID=A0ABN9L388_9NEOB|nr:unnamed protein product [Ranitomeya imitator]
MEYKVHLRPKIQFTKPHIMRPAARHATSACPRPMAAISGHTASSGARRRRVRCRKCQACLQTECGTCHYCKDMKKFGGPGRMKQSCMQRQCLAPRLPHSVTCAVCEEVDQTSDSRDFEKKLMECSMCNEIVHPGCLEMDGEGLLSDELPNYWECPKCNEQRKHTVSTDQEKVLLHNKRKAVDNCDQDPHLSAKVLRPPLGQSPPSPPLLLLPPSPSSGPPTPPATTPQASHASREDKVKRRQLTREKENHPTGREHSEADRAWHRSSYLTVTLQRPPKELSSSSIVPKLQAITPNPRHHIRPPLPPPPDEDEEDEDEDEDDEAENGLIPGQRKDDLSMQKDVWLSVFQYLTRKELCICMRVCKAWYKWGCDKRLWSRIDMSRCKSLMPQALSGIIKRQPMQLDLSWTNVSKKQLTWLVNRLPALKELILAGCSWSAVSALSSSSCPLLRTLDLRWGHDSRSKLRFLTDLRLSGLDISDVTLRLIIRYCPHLCKLDLSHCPLLIDQSVNLLTAVGSSTRGSLTHIHLAALSFSALAVSTAAGKQSGDVTALLSGCPALTARAEKQSAGDRQRGFAVRSGASHLHTMTSSSLLPGAAPAQAYFVCPVEGRAKYCSAQASGKVREARRLRTAVLCSALNRADKVRLRRSRDGKQRRGRDPMKIGGPGPRHPSDQTAAGPPLVIHD